jgi:uncharacterized protein YjiK
MKRILTIIISIAFLVSCQKDNIDIPVVEIPEGSLKLIHSYQLDILEPSGISFGPDRQTLLIVSDNANLVYETTLEGEVIRTLNYVGADLEGVVYNPDENIVAVAEERLREVVLVDYEDGNEFSRYHINVDDNNSLLWILSDDSQALYKCDYKANVLMEFLLPEAKYEGVVIDIEPMKAYFVNDATARLEVFNIEN